MKSAKMMIVAYFLLAIVCTAKEDLTTPMGKEFVKDQASKAVHRSQQRQTGSCSCDAKVYAEPNFEGRSILIQQQNANFEVDFFEHMANSISITGQCDYIFYQCHDFIGRAHVLKSGSYASPPSWGGKGHQIASARALPAKGTVAISLFEHVNYRGRMFILNDSDPDLKIEDFDNEVSSVIVTGGSWTLYEQSEYTGNSINLTVGQFPMLQYSKIGQDTLSSVMKN